MQLRKKWKNKEQMNEEEEIKNQNQDEESR